MFNGVYDVMMARLVLLRSEIAGQMRILYMFIQSILLFIGYTRSQPIHLYLI
jgi:hypothetical protein